MCTGKRIEWFEGDFLPLTQSTIMAKIFETNSPTKIKQILNFFDAFTETFVFVDDKGVGWNLMQLQGNF